MEKITNKQLRQIIKESVHQYLIETDLDKKLGGYVKGNNEIDRLRDLRDKGQRTMVKNGRTVDIDNEIARKERQLGTFSKGAARDIAFQTSPNRERMQAHQEKLLKDKKYFTDLLAKTTSWQDKQKIKEKLHSIDSNLADTYGYSVHGNPSNGYSINTPMGHAYSSRSGNGINYDERNNNSGNVNRLANLQGISDAMMGYDEELNGGMDNAMQQMQRRQRNVQALRDYDQDMEDYNSRKADLERQQFDYDRKPFFQKWFSKRPEANLTKPEKPQWEPNENGEFDGYFAHENPEAYNKDMEATRQRKLGYQQALNKRRNKQ